MSAKWYDWLFNPIGTVTNKTANDYTEEQNKKQFNLAEKQFNLQNQQFNYQKQYDAWQQGMEERNFAFQQDSYYNNYQNAVADMSKAGLNPLMMSSPAGAGSASVSGSNVQSSASPSYNPQQLSSSMSPVGLMQGVLNNLTQRKNAQDFVNAQTDVASMNRKMALIQGLLDFDLKSRELDILSKKYGVEEDYTRSQKDRADYELEFLKKYGLLGGSNSSTAVDTATVGKNIDRVQSSSFASKQLGISEKELDNLKSISKTSSIDNAWVVYESLCKQKGIKPYSKLGFKGYMFFNKGR